MSGYDEEVPRARVLRGEPTEEELAAVMVALGKQAAARAATAGANSGPRGWNDRSRLMRRDPRTGADAWRATAWVDR